MKAKQRYHSVEDYIESFSDEIQIKLKKLRSEIHDSVPNLVESISYQMPTFELNDNRVHFAAYKNHIAIYPGPEAIEAFKDELDELIESKGTIRIPIDSEIPFELIRIIVQYALKENFKTDQESIKKFGDNKEILLSTLLESTQDLIKQLSLLDDEQANLKIRAFDRSPLEMIKHLIAWMKLIKYWDEKELKSSKEVSPNIDYKYDELTFHYQNMYKQHEELSLKDYIDEYTYLTKIYEKWITSISEEELFTQGNRKWTGEKENWPISKWIYIHVIVPSKKYGSQLKKQ